MIELKNISKTYPTKSGGVKALKDVSFCLDSTGMVFILGKSGSGKSTLLNIIGGLDKADDSGTMIVGGHLVENFTDADFNSYRNTHIGFIFQEYHLLDDFTAAKNISLATELQGKEADSQKIESVLARVGLEGYGDRKPGALSGGEKQRVAIARALIKEPSILIADEPSGALDSETGEQIFDLLKELSKDKLVIVVSHDRDYALKYGDRVIELKDGRIISDSKTTEKLPADIKENEKQKNTSDKKIELIKSKLSYKNSLKIGAHSLKVKRFRLAMSVIIAAFALCFFGIADAMASYNKVKMAQKSMLDLDITYASFIKEANDKNNNAFNDALLTDKDIRFISEKNPGYDFKGVLSIGSSYHNTYSENLAAYGDPLLGEYYNDFICGAIEFTDADLEKNSFNLIAGRMPKSGETDKIAISKYVYENFIAMGYKDYEKVKQINSPTDLIGETMSLLQIEIGLPGSFEIVGIIDTKLGNLYDKLKMPYDENDVNSYSLSGNFKRMLETSYHCLIYVCPDFAARTARFTAPLISSFSSDNLNAKIGGYIRSTFLESERPQYYGGGNFHAYFSKIGKLSDVSESIIFWRDGQPKTSLAENEVILNTQGCSFSYKFGASQNLSPYFNDTALKNIKDYACAAYPNLSSTNTTLKSLFPHAEIYLAYMTAAYNNLRNNGGYFNSLDSFWETTVYDKLTKENLSQEEYDNFIDKFSSFEAYSSALQQAGVYRVNSKVNVFDSENTAAKLAEKAYQYCADTYFSVPDVANIYLNYYGSDFSVVGSDMKKYDIVGIYHSVNDSNTIILPDSLYGLFENYVDGVYSNIIAPLNSTRTAQKKLVVFGFSEFGDVRYPLKNIATDVTDIESGLTIFIQVFLIVGIVFVLFAALILFNFLSVSISNRKRDIGVLRAMGARSKDVFFIFFNESLLICIMNFVLSILLCFIGAFALNKFLQNQIGVLLTFIVFGFRQILVIFAINIFIAFLASFLPVYKICRMKPIDAIRK